MNDLVGIIRKADEMELALNCMVQWQAHGSMESSLFIIGVGTIFMVPLFLFSFKVVCYHLLAL